MAEKKTQDVHLETMEETKDQSEELKNTRYLARPGLSVGEHPARLLANSRKPVLKCSITNEKLVHAGYKDILQMYEQIRKKHLND